jgi:hypothetical protein
MNNATIGLDRFTIQKSQRANGIETTPHPSCSQKQLRQTLCRTAEATLYADDGPQGRKEFKSGTLSLGVDDVGKTVAEDLTGRKSTITRGHRGIRRRGDPVGSVPRQESNGSIAFLALQSKFGFPHQSRHKGRLYHILYATIEDSPSPNKLDKTQASLEAEVTEGDADVAPLLSLAVHRSTSLVYTGKRR